MSQNNIATELVNWASKGSIMYNSTTVETYVSALDELQELADGKFSKGFMLFQSAVNMLEYGKAQAKPHDRHKKWEKALDNLQWKLPEGFPEGPIMDLIKDLSEELQVDRNEAKVRLAFLKTLPPTPDVGGAIKLKRGLIEHDIPTTKLTQRVIDIVKYSLDSKMLTTHELLDIMNVSYGEVKDKNIKVPENWAKAQELIKKHVSATEYSHLKDLMRTPTLEWFYAVTNDTDDEEGGDPTCTIVKPENTEEATMTLVRPKLTKLDHRLTY